MIWNDFHFYSETLGIQTAAYVLLPDPQRMEERAGQPLPTLYLLHGLSDDHTAWMRNSRVINYAEKLDLAIVMPAVNRSFYTDMVHGARYWTFISDELPRIMEACFPLRQDREGRFAAGLSMGGYGAMKLGLLRPERYAAVAALSAPLWMHEAMSFSPDKEWLREMADIFGSEEQLRNGEGNLALAAEKLAPESVPSMYVACGTEDFLFEANEMFISHYGSKLGIAYETVPGESHTWSFWDQQIQKVLLWLPLPGEASR